MPSSLTSTMGGRGGRCGEQAGADIGGRGVGACVSTAMLPVLVEVKDWMYSACHLADEGKGGWAGLPAAEAQCPPPSLSPALNLVTGVMMVRGATTPALLLLQHSLTAATWPTGTLSPCLLIRAKSSGAVKGMTKSSPPWPSLSTSHKRVLASSPSSWPRTEPGREGA